ncbi:YciI family protein [Zhihengliuella sp.]|uniref:YciI family protein n=1 Tax=Zhihengliuella sp. TaxID=1954483 RepID=UPI002810E542|nr:YciI family protein [Zhihengliuella sp.]
MSLFAVEYVYAPDTEEARAEHRAQHRELLAGLQDPQAVKLVASGPFGDGSGALLIFAAAGEEAVNDVLKQDPFVAQGLVANAKVTEWNPVTGELAAYAS